MEKPLVSVIVPVYNVEEYLEDLIRDILEQTVADFELLLVNMPKNLIELTETIYVLSTQKYESDKLTFINSGEFKVWASEDMAWSLDGEYQQGCGEIVISNLHHAIDLIADNGKE